MVSPITAKDTMAVPPYQILIFTLASLCIADYPESKDWVQRPGHVYVCEGETAFLLWNYNISIGDVYQVELLKQRPEWKYIYDQKAGEPPRMILDRAYLIPNTTCGIKIINTRLSDSGAYEMNVFIGDGGLFDTSQLSVIPSSACPDKLRYKYPTVYLTQLSGDQDVKHVDNNEHIELSRPGNVIITVVIPAADPPCNCSITRNTQHHSCSGLKNREMKCESNMSFWKQEDLKVTVVLSYIAMKPSITTFHVHVKSWLQRPERNEFACEGDTATFIWSYHNGLGEFVYLNITKSSPDPKKLIEMSSDNNGRPIRYLVRANLNVDGYYDFSMSNVSVSDSGTYIIRVHLTNPTTRLTDEIKLHVINSTDCPNRHNYNYPSISFMSNSPGTIPVEKNTVELPMPGNVTLMVVIPSGNPPVKCNIRTSVAQKGCIGSTVEDKSCTMEYYIDGQAYTYVNVTLIFLAFKPVSKLIAFSVKVDGQNSTSEPHSPPTSTVDDSNPALSTYIIVGVILFLLACSATGFVVLYRRHTRNRAKASQKYSQVPLQPIVINSGEYDILLFYMDEEHLDERQPIACGASTLRGILSNIISIGPQAKKRPPQIQELGVGPDTTREQVRHAFQHTTYTFVLVTVALCETDQEGKHVSKALDFLQKIFQDTVSKPEKRNTLVPVYISNDTLGKVPHYLQSIRGISVTSLLKGKGSINTDDPDKIKIEDVDENTLGKISRLLDMRKNDIFERQNRESAWHSWRLSPGYVDIS